MLLDDSWKNITDVYVYGNGKISKKNVPTLRKYVRIKGIIDRNGDAGTIALSEAVKKIDKEKIIVCANKKAYDSIKADLDSAGMREFRDYIKLDDFLTFWMYQFKKMNCIREVHYSINTKCDFRCKKCNMFMPYYEEEYEYSRNDVEKDLALFFDAIDFVFTLSFLGGEPFLNKQISEIIYNTFDRFGERIGCLEIYTNGSVIPDDNTLIILKKCKVFVRISDYTEQIKYRPKLNMFMEKLSVYGIRYEINKSTKWLDFKFPDTQLSKPYNNVREHMLKCNPSFRGLNDGKFYYCHVCWSAEKAGLFRLKESDYIDLKKIRSDEQKRQVVHFSNGEMISEGSYISLCAVCAGCGDDNIDYITAAEQRRNI